MQNFKDLEDNTKKTPNLEIFRKSHTNFRKPKGKHKEDTKLRIFKDQEGTKNMQIRKIKRKQKHAIDTKLKI